MQRGQTVTNAERATDGESRIVDLDGPVHYVDFGGLETGPAVVLVHGLGGSHLNWDLLAPLLPGMELPPHPMRLGSDEGDYYRGAYAAPGPTASFREAQE